jgi:hypothetical protein
LGGKTGFSAKYQDFKHSTLFMNTDNAVFLRDEPGKLGQEHVSVLYTRNHPHPTLFLSDFLKIARGVDGR